MPISELTTQRLRESHLGQIAWNANIPIEERFWSKVEKTENCWIWKGSRNKQGYGAISFRKRVTKAHRVSYILTYGEIPDGFFVCHKCDNPPCVRPDHLFLGTRTMNSHDALAKGRLVKPLAIFEKFRDHWTGERSGRHKLTWVQVDEIRKEYVRRINSFHKIAKKYGVADNTICAIISGKTWKDEDRPR